MLFPEEQGMAVDLSRSVVSLLPAQTDLVSTSPNQHSTVQSLLSLRLESEVPVPPPGKIREDLEVTIHCPPQLQSRSPSWHHP